MGEIEVRGLTKRFGAKRAVDDLSFDVRPGVVTGFLGPNGSGKSTTMRCMIGLDLADSGTTAFDGRAYRTLKRPLCEVGALFDAGYVHPGRSARNHLRWLAASNGIPVRRCDELLERVGLAQVANRRVGAFSLGMRQRLGLAGALIGDPHTMLLDEPANGLDPEGVRWIRDFLVAFARQGRSVLVSSHLLSEMSLMADELVIIGRGQLIERGPVSEFVDRYAQRFVRVASPQLPTLVDALRASGAEVTAAEGHADVNGMAAAQVGEIAARLQLVLHELSTQTGSLEDAFLAATGSTEEYRMNLDPRRLGQPDDPMAVRPAPGQHPTGEGERR